MQALCHLAKLTVRHRNEVTSTNDQATVSRLQSVGTRLYIGGWLRENARHRE